jgi:hypothetical protein
LLTGPHDAFAPLPEHAAPVFWPVVQVPFVVHCALVVQFAPTLPAVHLFTAPHWFVTPFTVQD